MPSVASEANAIIHHRSKASRNPSAANGRNPEGPFASLLDTDVETPAASKPQKPGPRQPARRSQAATDARPAASLKQARKPAAEKTPDAPNTPDTGDAEKPAETTSETGETPDIAADLAAAAPRCGGRRTGRGIPGAGSRRDCPATGHCRAAGSGRRPARCRRNCRDRAGDRSRSACAGVRATGHAGQPARRARARPRARRAAGAACSVAGSRYRSAGKHEKS